jgi:transcriptional regulator with XRE-family HTH domain
VNKLIELDIKKMTIEQANQCLSLNELAKKSGITRTGISSLIHGKTKATPKTIGKLARALNVNVTEIIAKENE